ncbi:hypothetical protein LOTGIDRAFT_176316, partial [Lottia gigantea]
MSRLSFIHNIKAVQLLDQNLDTSCDGYVDWDEFCTYMLLLYRENDYIRSKKEIPFLQEPKIRHIVPNKQEQTTRILSIDNPTRFVTLSRVIKVWDVKEQTCVQTIVLKFPSSIHGRMPEHGQFPIHLQPIPHNSLLVTCNDYIGMMKLGKGAEPQSVMPLTHDTQLCCAIYNQFFKQQCVILKLVMKLYYIIGSNKVVTRCDLSCIAVCDIETGSNKVVTGCDLSCITVWDIETGSNKVVTGCDSSCIAVWDIETGNKAVVFSNAHGEEEITTMVFDDNWRRLITGARNGSIKVWNFQNGHNLHKLEAAADAEVTGILPILDKRVIMAVDDDMQVNLDQENTTLTEGDTVISEYDELSVVDDDATDGRPDTIDVTHPNAEIRPQTISVSTKARVKTSEFPRDKRLQYRSQTYPTGFDKSDPTKTFLGMKAERDFARKQQDRK